MKKLLFVGLLYAALGAASVLTSELLAATLTVTNSNDSGPGSLRESIAIAAPGDEIQFDAGLVSKPIVLISGELLISKDLTITGLGESQTILDGNAVTRILNIASDAHVAISNLTIRNGFDGHLLASGVVGEGGGVYNAGTLSLTRVSILSNTAGLYGIHALSVRGGGVFNNGTITFDHCSLGHNQAVGEISAGGGAIYNLGSATLNATKISDNIHQVARAHGVLGAAIYNESSATAILVDSEVARNTGVAGGILNYGVIVLSRTTVSDNLGSLYAAIANGGDATLTDSIIRGNNACPLATVGGIENGGFPGAGFHVQLRADRVLVSENSSCGRSGGIENFGEMRLTNSTVTNNSVVFGAGGIINYGTADIVSCTITGNRSNNIGGIAMERGDLRIKNTILTGNFCPISNFPGQECGGINTNCGGTGTSLGNNLLSNNSACVWLGDAHLTDAVAADWETIFEGADIVSYGRAPLLAENGGPTPTIALLPDSAALDFIPPEACTDQEGNPMTVDQRGTSRPQGPGCDIGAFEFSQPRGAGFWAHQCSDKGYLQVSASELQALFAMISDASSAFPECAPISCDFLQPQNPKNDMRARAQQGLLDVWLNVTSGRLTRGRPIDLAGLTTATTVGEALSQLETIVCDPTATRSDLGNAKDIAEALNGSADDLELATTESSLSLMPGATRTITLGLINMSETSRNYSLTVSSPWPVRLSASRVNALGSGQEAQITATVTAPLNTEIRQGQFRISATDLATAGTLSRNVAISMRVVSGSGFQPAQKPTKVE